MKNIIAKDSSRLIVLDGTEKKLNLFPDILLRALGLIALFIVLPAVGIGFGLKFSDEIDAWFTFKRQFYTVMIVIVVVAIRLGYWGIKKMKEQ
jgi:hypothetical protein